MFEIGDPVIAGRDGAVRGQVDEQATHPDGQKLNRVCDHWFPTALLRAA